MGTDRPVTMEYLAKLAGVNVKTVRGYINELRPLVGDLGLLTAQDPDFDD